jgi:hypothetical protein
MPHRKTYLKNKLETKTFLRVIQKIISHMQPTGAQRWMVIEPREQITHL